MTSPVVIVTGASKGLGLTIAQILLTTFNASVIAVSRSLPEELKSLTSLGKIEFVQGDATKEETSAQAVKFALDKFGKLDALILNAGTIDPIGPIADPANTVQQWADTFQINLFSIIHMLQHATPHLRKAEHGGKVVMVSSGAATGNTFGWGCYNTSKAALNSLCRTFANEEKSISSFAVRPGMVDVGLPLERTHQDMVKMVADKKKRVSPLCRPICRSSYESSAKREWLPKSSRGLLKLMKLASC